MTHHPSISTEHYQALFESSPASFLILLPDADFTIVAATEDYLRDTLTQRENIVGRPVFEVFPDNPDDPESQSTRLLAESFLRVIATKSVDTMALLRYDIPKPDGSGFEQRYWRPVNKPTLSPDGEILYIIHRAQDVTDFVQLLAENKAHKRERAELTAQKMIMEKEVEYRSVELAAKNAELLSTNEKLKQYTDRMREEANRKDEFLAMLAHELRNPLAPIAAAADLLSLGHPDETRIKQTSGIIRRQAKHMTGLEPIPVGQLHAR
ncbi:histidine kinase dimerization/phospho-acceptor domain-containing protein [Noviherbaspirillum pedocola]|uniref:histidine kinase n=1 Tax=Noviherbaspirillum pedocola TaxID=2801341 RepID=A0A934T489_9BURK|nr:histidine kinase dimerization/phospho-acceptor domain-containing protein [Noviherbaspirillum pedocola]MBK4739103.1 PAS domain-containing protein [Noviherbaspirillum pedocola]